MYEPPYPQGPGQPGQPDSAGQWPPPYGGTPHSGPPYGGTPHSGPPGPWPPPPGGWDHPAPAPAPPPGQWQPAPPPGQLIGPGPGGRPPVVADTLVSENYSGWWLRGLAIVQAGWKQLLLVQLIAAVVAFAVRAAVSVAVVRNTNAPARLDPNDPFAASPTIGNVFSGIGLLATGQVLATLVTVLATLASLRIGLTVVAGGRPALGDMFRFAAMRTLPLIGWSLVAGLTIALGVCLCVVPGFYLAGVFMVLPAVVAFERGNAIGRCFTLFHGSAGVAIARVATIFGLTLAGFAVAWAITAGINALADDAAAAGTVTGAVTAAAISTVIIAAVRVLVDPLILTTYADLRARVEPFSVTALVQANPVPIATSN
jgi:hypothetical protein